jgi:hypothetical protein
MVCAPARKLYLQVAQETFDLTTRRRALGLGRE